VGASVALRIQTMRALYSVVVLQPFGCAKGIGNLSDGTLSTDSAATDVSRQQQSRSRPRSLVFSCRSPSYASDTVSSMQLRASRSGCGSQHDGTSGVDPVVVCSRFRKFKISTSFCFCANGIVTVVSNTVVNWLVWFCGDGG
jgi:hypothetical protein